MPRHLGLNVKQLLAEPKEHVSKKAKFLCPRPCDATSPRFLSWSDPKTCSGKGPLWLARFLNESRIRVLELRAFVAVEARFVRGPPLKRVCGQKIRGCESFLG